MIDFYIMVNENITLKQVYEDLQNLKEILKRKKIIGGQVVFGNEEIIGDSSSQNSVLVDESLLNEDWLSLEDEEAWKDL
jgi:hypothetical protein